MPSKSGPATIPNLRFAVVGLPLHGGTDTARLQDRGYRRSMRCPTCTSLDDKVVDSRLADDGVAIRRRRECLGCGRRFTTFERIEEVGLVVVKRSGLREPFKRSKVVAGVRAAAKNRPVGPEQLEELAADVEEALRLEGSEASSARVGAIVLERLRALDEVAYVRFASVYKGFDAPGDFEREVLALTQEPPPSAPPPPAQASPE
jgi:transcriptional repressor NrdR